MPDNDQKSAIDRFLSNGSDYVEAEQVSEYLKANVQALDAVDLCDDLREDEVISVSQAHKERVLQRVFKKKQGAILLWPKLLAAAAVIGIVFLVAKLYDRPGNIKKDSPSVLTAQVVANNTLKILNYLLPDSSLMELKPGAKAVFMSDYRDKRAVTVAAGEVFFKVHKNPRKPFVVSVNGIHVTALGTAFWVRNFKTLQVVSVDLTEGKLRVNAADAGFKMDTVYLKPGYNCTIDKQSGKVVVSLIGDRNNMNHTLIKDKAVPYSNDKNGIVWTNDEIRFLNVPLENVLKKIENNYHVTIIADAAIRQTYLTGKMYHTDSLSTLIKTICELNDLSYEQHNDTIFIKK